MAAVLLQWCVVAIVAYLIGSIPSGLLIGRLFFGIDVREYGSRRTGATNVLRTMGKKPAIAAMLMDIAKGVIAVAIARWLLPTEPWAHALAGVLVAVGHNWPIFVGFRGGRGVVVSVGVVGMLYWPVLVILVVIGLLIVWRTRYVSLASVVGAVATFVLFLVFFVLGRVPSTSPLFSTLGTVPLAYLVYALAGAALVIASHKDNIARLRAGTEARLGQRVQRVA